MTIQRAAVVRMIENRVGQAIKGTDKVSKTRAFSVKCNGFAEEALSFNSAHVFDKGSLVLVAKVNKGDKYIASVASRIETKEENGVATSKETFDVTYQEGGGEYSMPMNIIVKNFGGTRADFNDVEE